MSRVVITRDSVDSKIEGRVYITGPHFGADIFSSTQDPSEASTFTMEEAEHMIRSGKWRGSRPVIENAYGLAKEKP